MRIDEDVWRKYAPMLQAALDAGGNTHALADVRELIEDDCAQLWVGPNSAAVTEVLEYPRFRALHVWLAAGDLGEVVAGDSLIAQFAKDIEAQRITVDGRLGWKRVLAPHGYRAARVTLMRVIQ